MHRNVFVNIWPKVRRTRFKVGQLKLFFKDTAKYSCCSLFWRLPRLCFRLWSYRHFYLWRLPIFLFLQYEGIFFLQNKNKCSSKASSCFYLTLSFNRYWCYFKTSFLDIEMDLVKYLHISIYCTSFLWLLDQNSCLYKHERWLRKWSSWLSYQ